MVDYARALKRPFADIPTLAVGIVVSLIPIVNFLALGYFTKVIEATMKKDYEKMPAWKEYADLFVRGLIIVVMTIIYMLPALAVVLLGAGSLLAGGIALFIDPTKILAAIMGAGIFFLIALVLALVAAYFQPAAVIGYIKSKDISAFFDFGTIIGKSMKMEYFITWLVMAVIMFVITIVLAIVPIVGMAAASFISGVATYTALTEAYNA